MLAYVFMIGHIRGSRRFRRIVKALSDNAADIALRTHSLLAGIRTLASKARIRFISGKSWPVFVGSENIYWAMFDRV